MRRRRERILIQFTCLPVLCCLSKGSVGAPVVTQAIRPLHKPPPPHRWHPLRTKVNPARDTSSPLHGMAAAKYLTGICRHAGPRKSSPASQSFAAHITNYRYIWDLEIMEMSHLTRVTAQMTELIRDQGNQKSSGRTGKSFNSADWIDTLFDVYGVFWWLHTTNYICFSSFEVAATFWAQRPSRHQPARAHRLHVLAFIQLFVVDHKIKPDRTHSPTRKLHQGVNNGYVAYALLGSL